MGHDYIECTDADCQLCQGYEDGYSAGQAMLARTLRHVRDNGSFPPDVDARKACTEPCEHDYCHLVETLAFCYRAVSKHLNTVNADLWAQHNPELAEQLRDVLGADDDAKEGGTD